MELLHPRAAYRRANSEEPDSHQSSTVELSSINSMYGSDSATKTLLADHAVQEIRSDSPLRILHAHLFELKRYAGSHSFRGWRVGALAAAALALLSLLINIAVVAWLGSQGKGAALIEVFNGSCSKVQRMDIWTHLAINALSTLLLGGSNYCMQCLCAPTRSEVDIAHSRGTWLDIGVPSVRNLGKLSKPRVMLWWMLGLSSVPLHLM